MSSSTTTNSSSSAYCAPSTADHTPCVELTVNESNESKHEPSAARSYYSLTRSYPLLDSVRRVSVHEQPQLNLSHRIVGDKSMSGLSRPPRQLAPQPVLEAPEQPVRATAVVVPQTLPSPVKDDAQCAITACSSVDSVSCSQPTLVFVPQPATEEKAKPVLCPPPRCVRVRQTAEVATSPFYVSGIGIGQLPRYGQTALPTRWVPGRSTVASSASSTPVNATGAEKLATLWDEAATAEDVIAFFGPGDAVVGSEQGPLPLNDSRRSVSKDASWLGADGAHSSVCDLSLSDDIFSAGTTVKKGSPVSGAIRSQVIDLQAALQFQRNGSRRQRETIATSH